MALNLEPDEIIRVNRARSASRPTYYNDGLGTTVEASEDFETFLILAKSTVKQAAVGWLQGLVVPTNMDILRQMLYETAVAVERSDLEAVNLQLEALVHGYNVFQEQFPGDARFAEIPEVRMIVEDAALPIQTILSLQESVKHRIASARACSAIYGGLASGLTESRKRRALSWIVPLTIPQSIV